MLYWLIVMQEAQKNRLIVALLILAGLGLALSGYVLWERYTASRQTGDNNVVTTIRGVPPPQPK